MKKINIIKSLSILASAVIVLFACTKDISDVRLDPKISSANVPTITSSSAEVIGYVLAQGNGFTEKGICYGSSANPTISNSKVIYTGDATGATFSITITGLDYATTYHARAYATGTTGTIYGEDISFTTLPVMATVTTSAFTAKTGTTATGGGSVTADGGADVTAYGVCYSTSENPTIEDSHTTDGTGLGEFTSSLTGLEGETTYYVKAYATNSAGTAYGEQVSFTTPKAIIKLYIAGAFQNWDPANAKDSLMNSETDNIVQGYAYLTAGEFKFTSLKSWDGTNYGVGSTDGTLSSSGENLSVSADGYYLFQLDMDAMTYTITKTSWGVIGSGTADQWNSDQNMAYSTVLRRWVATIPLTANEIKFRANDDWALNYGDDNNNGSLEAGGSNIPVAAAGTYTLMMNLSSPLNYSYTKTQWGLIGSAAGSWSDDQNMTPNVDNTWTITTHLDAGDIKFRANDGWDINYGGSGGNIVAGGDNITISTAGNYTVTLDLVNGTYSVVSND